MPLRKQFVSDRLGDGTQSAGQTENGTLHLPAIPIGGIGTGRIAGSPALLFINNGPTEATFSFAPNGAGVGNLSIPPGHSQVLVNGEYTGPWTYSGGPLTVVSGSIVYVFDMSADDTSPVVDA